MLRSFRVPAACALLLVACASDPASPSAVAPTVVAPATTSPPAIPPPSPPDTASPITTETTTTGIDADAVADEASDDSTASEPELESDARAWPQADWPMATAAEAGLDPSSLDALADAAQAGGSDCLVVTHDGRLIAEWYWNGTDARTEQEAYSVTKSITSTLVGIAIDRGLLGLDQPASDFIDEWIGTPSETITVRNLLANDSGRFQDFETDYIEMAGQAEDKTAFSIALTQQFEPGTEWVYNNAAIQTLEAVLEEATGQAVGEFATEVLFEPLGMDTSIITDAAGNTLTFMGAQASCRDLARFGLLHLRDGEWNGEQIVSPEWVETATRPSTDLTSDYGLLWWLNVDESLVPDAPEDAYAALGLFNQFVVVLPSDDVVVTRMGDGSGSDGTAFDLGDVFAGIAAARLG